MNKSLSVKEIKALPSGVHAVGGVKGLYIRKTEKNEQYFLRWKKNGAPKKKFYPLGTSLKEARERALNDRKLIDQGKDLKEEEEAAKTLKAAAEEAKRKEAEKEKATFKKVALDWLKYQKEVNAWRNNQTGEYHAQLRLEKYLFPVFGNTPVSRITIYSLADFFTPIWAAKAGTADKLYNLMRSILKWAVAKGTYQLESNPVDRQGPLGELLKPLTKSRAEKDNHAALDFREIPEFIEALLELNSSSSLAVAFSILTASRFKAVRLAEWEEIDFKNKCWNIPESHDKVKGRKRLRTILLSDEALSIVKRLPRISRFIFPSKTHLGALSENATSMLIRGMDTQKASMDGRGWKDFRHKDESGAIAPVRITQHGTARATFKTWAKDDELGNNQKFDQEAVEMCLLHSRKDAYRGAYDRSQLLKERRTVIDEWGAYCFSRIGKPKE